MMCSNLCDHVSVPNDTGYLRGAEVVAQRSFPLTLQAHSFEWREYGFMLHVPEGSLPPEMTQTTVDVRVSLSGQFEFPEDSDLVSATYWLSCPHKFMKPLDVEFQHCAAITDPSHCSQLRFVISKSTQGSICKFKELEGGTFSQHSSYGRISLTDFSGLGIVRTLRRIFRRSCTVQPESVQTIHVQPVLSEPATKVQIELENESTTPHTLQTTESSSQIEGPVVQYCAQIYRSKRTSDWRVKFVITKDLEACLTVHYACMIHSQT